MQFDSVLSVKSQITKEQFLRRLLIKLANTSESPADITKSCFGEVKESCKEVIFCQAHVECDYTVSIGYDREEIYWDKEEKYNYSTKQYNLVDVKKTRIVTDWRPHSGHIANDVGCLVFNGESNLSGEEQDELLAKVIASVNRDSIREAGEATVSRAGLETAKEACRAKVEMEINYPGDHFKDEDSTASIDIKKLTCCKLACYEVDFVYDDTTYHAWGFACNESSITTELPPDNGDIAAVAEVESRSIRIFKSVGWWFFVGTWLLSFILGLTTNNYWSIFLPLVAFVVALGLHINYINKYNNTIKALKEDDVNVKLNELKKTLEQYGYDELTKEELETFDSKAISEEYGAEHKKKGIALPLILGSVALIVLLILVL